MSTSRVTTAIALVASLALTALPAAAQDGRRESGNRRARQAGAERSGPRESGNRGAARAQQGQRRQRADGAQADRGRERAEAVPRAEPRTQNGNRGDQARRDSARNGNNNGNRNGNRNYNNGRNGGRPYVVVPAPRAYRSYPYYRQRSYVAPFGYRPYGYRPGWSVNLYFGRPYYGYGSRGYYGSGNYGYYAIPQGYAYGSLRIVDAPRDAQVFVDGYYAGVVDDYDGVFQRLNLEPGQHRVEVEVYPGAPPAEYDVYVAPGQTVTVHVRP